MALPVALVEAITAPGGGRIVLVVGAGCSVEAPTNLRLSGDYASEANRQLVQAGLLDIGDCDEWDLSSVADAVVAKHGSQVALVQRLPRQAFLSATPNRGYLLAAALMKEGVVKALVTLNYDLAISHALPAVSAGSSISVLSGPEDHHLFGSRNVVYLHRSANADPNDWVMTTQALEEDWISGWETVVTQSLVSAPVTIFAGLGSKAAVLTESVQKLRDRPGSSSSAQFLVGLSPKPDGNAFFDDLGIAENQYISAAWCQFMVEAAAIVTSTQLAQLAQACEDVRNEQGWDDQAELVSVSLGACAQLDLISLGRLRARWQLSSESYVAAETLGELGERAIAHLLIGIGHLQRLFGGNVQLSTDAGVEVWSGDRCIIRVAVAHGGGTRSLDLVQEELVRESELLLHGRRPSRRVLVGGVTPAADNPLPEQLTGDADPGDLIGGADTWSFVNIDDLRQAQSVDDLPWTVMN